VTRFETQAVININVSSNNLATEQTEYMKLIATILALTLFTACGQTQSQSADKKITRDFQQDIALLLPTGEYTVDIMDQVTMSPRRQELQEKFMQAVKVNSEWFMQQQKNIEQTGEGIPYDPRLGMTETEWEEYKKFIDSMSDMKVISSGTVKVKVIKTNNIITFKSEGKLDPLNNTSIDTKNKTVKMNNSILPLIDTICVTNSDNIFKTAWRGYKFQISNPPNATMPATQEELANYSMSIYGFTLGLFENSDKTYIEISASETSKGQQLTRYKIPIVFQ